METIGNTAIQVSPDVPTEEEMGKVQDMFGRALNAVLAHADLTKKVDTLSRDVQTLTARLESEVRYAQNLNTSLTETRQERDEARAKLAQTTTDLNYERDRVSELEEARKNQDERLTNATDTIARLRRESDDHAFKALELDEALQAERAKVRKVQFELESFKANIEKVLGGMAQAMQTPSPEEQAYDKDPGSVGHAPGPSAPAEEMAKSDPFPASETSTGAPTDPVSSGSEGQSATSPTSAPVLTPEAPSDAPSVGTSEPEGGGSPGNQDYYYKDGQKVYITDPPPNTKPVEPQREAGGGSQDKPWWSKSDHDYYR